MNACRPGGGLSRRPSVEHVGRPQAPLRPARGDAVRFVLRLVCAVGLPCALVIASGELILWRLSDGIYPAAIARRQRDDPQLAWVGPVRLFTAIKVARMRLEAPDVAVIGASRAGQFRSAMFKPYRFYNASMSGWSLDRQRTVLDLISAPHPPKVLIINLDYFFFQSGHDARWASVEATMPLEYSWLRANLDGLGSLATALASGFWRAATALAAQLRHPAGECVDEFRLFGMTFAPGSAAAFLQDGSMHSFPGALADLGQTAPGAGTLLTAVGAGNGVRMDDGHVARLRRFAELARQRGIALVGVQLPYDPAGLDVLDAGQDYVDGARTYRGADMKLWQEFEGPRSRRLFEEMGIIFVDLARIPESSNPRTFFDPTHPGEYLVLACVIALLKDRRVRALLPQIDIEALERTKLEAEAAHNYFDVFRDRF